MNVPSRHRREPDRSRKSFALLLLGALLILPGQTAVLRAQTTEGAVKRVLVTFDRSGSMQRFPHDRLNDYAARILFDGISRRDVDARDRWDVRAGMSESFFAVPLLQPGCQAVILKFSENITNVEIPILARDTLVAAGLKSRECGGRTDIASVVESACRFSERNWDDNGRTFWVFVSDDKPVSPHQTGEQARRLRALELVYEWDPVLMITVGDYDDPPLVEMREVYNRLYRRYNDLIVNIPGANETKLKEIQNRLDDLKIDIQRILQEKDLPSDLVKNIETRIANLSKQADSELYELRLGLFGLMSPGTTDDTSRFVEGEPVRFSWTMPQCEGVAGFTLQVRPVGATSVREERVPTNASALTGLSAGEYEWTVVAHGKSDLSALCSVTKAEGKWRRFRVGKPIGQFQLSTPQNQEEVLAGGVSFTWTPAANAVAYIVEVTPPNGTPRSSRRDVCHLTEPLSQLGLHTWRVKAVGPGDYPVLGSAVGSFMVVPEPEAPRLVSPKANAVSAQGTVLFDWTPVREAKRYAFEMRRPNGEIYRNDDLGLPTCSVTCAELGVYQWRAGSRRNAGEPRWAAESWRSFTISPPILLAPALVAPASGASVFSAKVSFEWKSVEHADGYELSLKADTGQPVDTVRVAGTRHEFQLPATGLYQWTVTAFNSRTGQQTPAADGWRVLKYRALPQPFGLLEPPNRRKALVPGLIRFAWEHAENARGYRLEIQHDATGNKTVKECTDEKVAVKLTDPGFFSWTVYALAEDGAREVAAQATWKVFISGAEAPQPLRPADGASVRPRGGKVKFTWTKARNATVKAYAVRLYQADANEANKLFLSKDVDGSLTNLAVDLAGGEYVWEIAALTDQEVLLESERPAKFVVKAPGGTGRGTGGTGIVVLTVVLLLVAGFGALLSVVLLGRPITVELALSGSLQERHSSYELTRARSRIYLAEVDGDGDPYFDIGVKDHFIQRGFLGFTLCGPGGGRRRLRWGEEFSVRRSDGADILLILSKPAALGGGRESAGGFNPLEDGPETGGNFDFQNRRY